MGVAKLTNLNDLLAQSGDTESHLSKRWENFLTSSRRELAPPFPRQIQIETTNICNHSCSFCAIADMERRRKIMSLDLFSKLAKECFDEGSREIGLFAGAEPLAHPDFLELVKITKKIGYEYIYISTNGTIGNTELFKQAILNGLSSIKFSINGVDVDHYKKVHGQDRFDYVIDIIKELSIWRKINSKDFFLGVSTVGYEDESEFEQLRKILDDYVDEVIFYKANNQSGQVTELEKPAFTECQFPFNKLHISVEGALKLCCNDYNNLLVTDKSNELDIPLLERWNSETMKMARSMHLSGDLNSSLCENCLNGKKSKPKTLIDIFNESKN